MNPRSQHNQPPIKPGTMADHAHTHIATHPGCTFTELHTALRPGSQHLSSTWKDRNKLLHAGLIRTQRDGRHVRHYTAQQ